MPRVGFIARFAMPVLNDREVMSRIAVPVVSEPVPAVVGTDKEMIYKFIQRATNKPSTSNERPERLCDWKTFSDRGVDEVH
jgi:hypothetical protein